MKKILSVTVLGLLISISFFSFSSNDDVKSVETNNAEGINWVSFEEAERLNKTTPKKIYIDVYTEWCGYCKKMDAGTFRNQKVVEYINENFYAVKFNAESPKTINFAGKEFKTEGRTNSLAMALQVTGYPTSVFMDQNNKLVVKQPGYLNANSMLSYLKYVNDEVYKTTSLDDYLK